MTDVMTITEGSYTYRVWA